MSYDILHMSIKATTNIRRSLWELTLEVQPGKTVWGWHGWSSYPAVSLIEIRRYHSGVG